MVYLQTQLEFNIKIRGPRGRGFQAWFSAHDEPHVSPIAQPYVARVVLACMRRGRGARKEERAGPDPQVRSRQEPPPSDPHNATRAATTRRTCSWISAHSDPTL